MGQQLSAVENNLVLGLVLPSLVAQALKASAYNVGDPGLIPGSGRSTGEGNGNPLQYSCLGNPMDQGAWQLHSMGWQRVRHD